MADAAFNRAREGIRVLEDLARFIINDRVLVTQLKKIRHDLSSFSRAWPGASLVLSRDTAGDVGTDVKTRSEGRRDHLTDIASAAGRRATEALRSLEELSKVVCPGQSRSIEQMRYQIYDLAGSVEKSIPIQQCRQWNLCVLITGEMCRHDWRDVARAAIEGGADCLQLREKNLTTRELMHRARELVSIAEPHLVDVVINDRPDVAMASGANAVHVGGDDLRISDVRAVVGDRLHVGVTIRSTSEAQEAFDAGASYVGVGPMFATSTKPNLDAQHLDSISDTIKGLVTRPHLLIGGIEPENIVEALSTGARGIAVCSCVCSAADPGSVTNGLVQAIVSHTSITADHA